MRIVIIFAVIESNEIKQDAHFTRDCHIFQQEYCATIECIVNRTKAVPGYISNWIENKTGMFKKDLTK